MKPGGRLDPLRLRISIRGRRAASRPRNLSDTSRVNAAALRPPSVREHLGEHFDRPRDDVHSGSSPATSRSRSSPPGEQNDRGRTDRFRPGSAPAAALRRTTDPDHASSSPAVPAMTASTRCSVSACRTSRIRLAPSEVRSENSWRRAAARARTRLATFAQPIRRTKPTEPASIHSARFVVVPTTRSSRVVARRGRHLGGCGRGDRAAMMSSRRAPPGGVPSHPAITTRPAESRLLSRGLRRQTSGAATPRSRVGHRNRAHHADDLHARC